MSCLVVAGAWLATALGQGAGGGSQPTATPPLKGEGLFAANPIRRLAIEIPPEEMASLRRDAREFVPATVREDQTVCREVAVHLKGSTGSFRGLDDKPSLTLDFARFQRDQRFHGLRRIYLNNSVEDPACVNEIIGSELFRAAGVPAPRVTRVEVTLNGRRLGLYVLKEGFTEDFLASAFRRVEGNLYDTDWGHDVDQRMKRNLGRGPRDEQSDLDALAAAAQEPDPERRWQRLSGVLDLDRFLSFMAMEVMICHRDGYCLARNNFRIYHDPETGRMVFLPHGMDQLLGKSDLPWEPHMAGLVARAVMELPEGRQRYRERFTALFGRLFDVASLTNRVNQLVGDVRASVSVSEFNAIAAEAAAVCDRLRQRHAFLADELRRPEPAPVALPAGVAKPGSWFKVDDPLDGRMDVARDADGRQSLHIKSGATTAASWRARVLLNPGRYRFEGKARVAAVRRLPNSRHQGAALRVAGETRADAGLEGDVPWRPLNFDFEIRAASTWVELICELRASGGDAWFDLDSLRLVKIQ